MLLTVELAALFITALTVGIIGNIAGIGGGVLIMAVFLFVFRISPVFAGIGAVLGSVVTYFVATKSFEAAFSFISISIGIFSIVATRRDIKRGDNTMLRKSFVMLSNGEKDELKAMKPGKIESSIVYSIAGLIAGFMGIGIGGITGTYLTAIRKANPKIAFSSVLAAMIVTSLLGSVVHFAGVPFEPVYMPIIGVLAVGAAAGAVAGAYASARVKSSRLRIMQGYIIVSLGLISLALTLLTG